MDLKRIVIKGASGYGTLDEAYEDKVTITADSISYEYKPHPESKLETNIHRKWTYKTTSPIFKELYQKVSDMAPYYLNNDQVLMATDIGPTEIVVTYEDGHKERVNYFCPSEFFREWFVVIKQMVPGCEYIPAVLITSEDYAEEE
ncbi:MAG: hypothetical protein Q4B26_20585 [Eubacteriales bacterium]|nr:hypothetical protein [Eubacteriales bacterium]